MRRVITPALAALAALAMASPASASLVFDSTIHVTAQGFGNNNRDLTVQAHGHYTTESGCVGVGLGGGITFGAGACIANLQVHDSNGFANTGGDEPMPQADDQKYGIPTIGELGWRSAADIGLLFNATEPSGDSIVINDITLKFYDATGHFITAIDGSASFTDTYPGNGVAGFVFDVDAPEQIYLNSLIFGAAGHAGYHIALESSFSSVAGGPESWVAFNLGRSPVPEPATWAMMLLGFGGIGIAMGRRRKASLDQIA